MAAPNPETFRKVLVTGAGGFVGTRLCQALAEHGRGVVAITRRATNPVVDAGLGVERLALLSEPEKWLSAMRSSDSVVHLAARAHEASSRGEEAEFERTNVEGSRFVADLAARAGVRRFIFLSSIKVNGEGRDGFYRTEDMPDPRDPYGRSKLAAEQAVREVCASSKMDLVIIRPPLVFGPGVRANFRKLIWLADLGIPLPFGLVENQRSLIGLYNLVDFIETCIDHPAAPGRVWLVADEELLSTAELLRRLSRHLNRSERLLDVSPAWLRAIGGFVGLGGMISRLCDSLRVDSSAARTLLDWRPKYSIDEELARTVEAYRRESER
jgi:UDP-glucose 4-epimerase